VHRLTFPEDGGFFAEAAFDLEIDAVVADVEASADEPLGVRSVPFEHLVPHADPVQLLGDAGPEFLGLINRLAVHPQVLFARANTGA